MSAASCPSCRTRRHPSPWLVWLLVLCLPLLQQLGAWHGLEHGQPGTHGPARVVDGGLFGPVDGASLHDCLQFDGAVLASFAASAFHWPALSFAHLPPPAPPAYQAPALALRRPYDGRAPPLLLS